MGSCEQNFEGGSADPTFNKNMIQTVLNVFNSGFRKRKPYCRTVLLPLNATYGVTMEMESLSFRGELLVTLPKQVFTSTMNANFLRRVVVRSRIRRCRMACLFGLTGTTCSNTLHLLTWSRAT